ncbi:hypothetical protein B0H21DRAFT_689499, partial [Amylocystis lapponica]
LDSNMDDSESPSPLDESSPTRRSTDQHRKAHRSSKDRERLYMGGSSRELARLMIYQERDAKDLRKMLSTTAEHVKAETQRADAAENRARDVLFRLKAANDAKALAEQETQRTQEELRLYRLQLENAQREIHRAQELLDSVEAQRLDAEKAAARARSTARKLQEERAVQHALEEGRKIGLEEGIERGRRLGFEEGRAEGYERGRAAAMRSRTYRDRMEALDDEPLSGSSSSREYETRRRSNFTQQQTSPPANAFARVPHPHHSPPAIVVQEPPKDQNIHPVLVHNTLSPSHPPVVYPPDSWVPEIDQDQRIRIPPPHEMGPPPPTPSPPPSLTLQNALNAADEKPMMIPPPSGGNYESTMSDSDSPPTPPVHQRPRHRRRRSSESESTTMSQFEILGPPITLPPAPRSNIRERPAVLSAIAEERERSSSVSSPAAGVNVSRSQRESFGSNEITFQVEPPSRPDSNTSRVGSGSPQRDFLSADDADRPMPPSTEDDPAPAGSSPVIPSLSSAPLPMVLPDGQLPPGFMATGPPVPMGSYTPQQPPGGAPGVYTGQASPADVPLPPSMYSGTPSVISNSVPGGFPAENVVIPHLPSGGHGVGTPSGMYSRTALRDSSSDSDGAVSSRLSGSVDTLTTPPGRRKKLPKASSQGTPTYAVAPIPPNVTYPVPPTPRSTVSHGSGAARVPLPPSAVTSPRSSAGYPYSRSAYSRSNVGLDAGRTPMGQNMPMSPIMGSARGEPALLPPMPFSTPGRQPELIPEDEATRWNTAANANPTRPPSAAKTARTGSPVTSYVSLAPTNATAKGKKAKKGKKTKSRMSEDD